MAQTERSKKIEGELLAKTQDSAAVELKKKWAKIGDVLATYGKPPVNIALNASDADITRYTDEFIKNREAEITLADGKKQKVSLSSIDTAIKEYNGKKKAGEMDYPPISAEIPTMQTLHKVAEATDRGASEQSEGPGKWGNAIAGFFSFLFQMIKSLFTGEKAPGLYESIANIAAPKVANSVQQQLYRESQTDPNVAYFLNQQTGNGQTVSSTIVDNAVGQTYATMGIGGKMPKRDATPDLASVVMEDSKIPSADSIKKSVYDAIVKEGQVKSVTFDALKKMRDDEVKKSTLGWKSAFAPSDAQLALSADKAAKLVAGTVSRIVTDTAAKTKDGKKLSDPKLPKEEFAKEMADRILADAEKDRANLGIPYSMFAYDSKTGKRPIDDLRPELEKSIAAQHSQLVPAMNATERNNQLLLAKVNSTQPKQPDSTQPANGFVPKSVPAPVPAQPANSRSNP